MRRQEQLSPEQQRERQLLNSFAAQTNKLRRKIEGVIDPYNDMLEAVQILQQNTSGLINILINERDTLKAELRAANETIKSKDEKIAELEKKIKGE